MVEKLQSTPEDEQMSKMPAYVPDRATQTLREYDERMGTRVSVPREATQTPSALATQGMLEGLERDRQAAQEAAAMRGEIRGELGSPMTRFVNEPVLETMRATPIVNYLAPAYTPSSATPYGQGAGGAAGGAPIYAPTPAGATGAAAPAMSPMEQQLAALERYYSGMRAAPGVAMNEDIRKGLAGQQAALGEAVSAIEGQIPGQEQERAAMLGEGRQYVGDLERLRAQQAGQFAQRRGRMAQDEAQMAQARQEFDPSRVLRQVGESPVSTAALSFAAGLVGALKGGAGDMGPNQILQEVDKAVERDTQQQLQKYQMLKDGIAVGQSNFNDMMRMGASEQQALAMTALASMDNHKRALEFAEQRVTTAKDKANLKGAISQLDLQRGKIKLDIDLKNAANWVAMNRARGEGMAKILELRQKMAGMDPETQKQVFSQYEQLTKGPEYEAARDQAEAVGALRKKMREIPVEQQKKLWDLGIGRVVTDALRASAIQGKEKGEIIGSASQILQAALEKQFTTPEQREMRNVAQEIINAALKARSGGSVTSGEGLRDDLTRDLLSYDGFRAFADRQEELARQRIQSRYSNMPGAIPVVQERINLVFAPALAEMDEYKRVRQDTAAMAQGAVSK